MLAPEGPEEEKLYNEIKKYGTSKSDHCSNPHSYHPDFSTLPACHSLTRTPVFIMQRHDPDYEPSEEADDYLWEFSQDIRDVFKKTEKYGHGTMYIEEGK